MQRLHHCTLVLFPPYRRVVAAGIVSGRARRRAIGAYFRECDEQSGSARRPVDPAAR